MSDLGKLFKGLIIAVIVLTIFAYLGVYIISLVISHKNIIDTPTTNFPLTFTGSSRYRLINNDMP